MSLLTFNKSTYDVEPTAEVLLVNQFKAILTRDKSKNKEVAKKELAFIYFYADMKSEYYLTDNIEERVAQIKLDIGLPNTWKIDSIIQQAIDFYVEKTKTVNSMLYNAACKSAMDITEYLKSTKELLDERTEKGAAVTNINTITGALSKVPKIMSDLNDAYKELVKEQLFSEGKKKGSREFNLFEEGL